MTYKEQIDPARVPSHIAIIMDGNGRWAKKQGSVRLVGHKFGVGSVRRVTEAAQIAGVKFLTLYAFSTENWNRPAAEVSGLMSLLGSTIESEIAELIKNNVRVKILGDGRLPESLRKKLMAAEDKTKDNTGLTLVLALSYSGRWEIAETARRIADEATKGGLDPEKVDEELFASYMPGSFMPDPELLIRTSGEYRISNFLLWQTAYSEFYFTETLWPDFQAEDLYKAIVDYQHRERRFGMTSEQIQTK